MKAQQLPRAMKRGLLITGSLLLLAAGGLLIRSLWQPVPQIAPTPEALRRELDSFRRLRAIDSLQKAEEHRRKAAERGGELFYFDPNEADSATFLRLGLPPYVAHNALQYRRAHGHWRDKAHFARLYGLDSAMYKRLAPYIVIAPTEADLLRLKREAERLRVDSLRRQWPEKYPSGTIVDLNAADTLTLTHIPGIGKAYAAAICSYRERLGGFVSTRQLEEIECLPRDIATWFEVLPDYRPSVRDINKLTFKELVHHPYLSYEQTKVIVNHIRKYGKLHDWADLSNYPEFTPHDFERLRPYFHF